MKSIKQHFKSGIIVSRTNRFKLSYGLAHRLQYHNNHTFELLHSLNCTHLLVIFLISVSHVEQHPGLALFYGMDGRNYWVTSHSFRVSSYIRPLIQRGTGEALGDSDREDELGWCKKIDRHVRGKRSSVFFGGEWEGKEGTPQDDHNEQLHNENNIRCINVGVEHALAQHRPAFCFVGFGCYHRNSCSSLFLLLYPSEIILSVSNITKEQRGTVVISRRTWNRGSISCILVNYYAPVCAFSALNSWLKCL